MIWVLSLTSHPLFMCMTMSLCIPSLCYPQWPCFCIGNVMILGSIRSTDNLQDYTQAGQFSQRNPIEMPSLRSCSFASGLVYPPTHVLPLVYKIFRWPVFIEPSVSYLSLFALFLEIVVPMFLVLFFISILFSIVATSLILVNRVYSRPRVISKRCRSGLLRYFSIVALISKVCTTHIPMKSLLCDPCFWPVCYGQSSSCDFHLDMVSWKFWVLLSGVNSYQLDYGLRVICRPFYQA